MSQFAMLRQQSAASAAASVFAAAPAYVPSEEDGNQVVEWLSGEINLFSDATEELEVEMTQVNALLIAAGSAQRCVDALKSLDAQQRKFKVFSDLLPALQEQISSKAGASKSSASPAAASAAPVVHQSLVACKEEDRQRLIDWLGSEECHLFDSAKEELEIGEADLDQLIIVSQHNIDECMSHCTMIEKLHRQFGSFGELIAAVKEAHESDCHISESDKERIIAILSSEETQLFSETQDELSVDGSDLDRLLLAVNGDCNKCCESIKRLDTGGLKLQSFALLVPAVTSDLATHK